MRHFYSSQNPMSAPERIDLTFLTSAPGLKQCPRDDVPEIAFAGRSNAGKSSVLNCISGNRQMAKVSRTPGRTQLLNLFDISPRLATGRIADLPGYGYAKAGKQAQAQWQASVNDYLSKRDNLCGLILVMDIRHPMQPFDLQLLEWADASELPVRCLLNKCDKLGFGKQKQTLNQVRTPWRDSQHVSFQLFSALKQTGKQELVDYVLELARGSAQG